MSGGVAYVLDLDESLVNTELVDVFSLPASHEAKVKELLHSFETETGSIIAAALVKDWDRARDRFSLILPRDYAKVLAAMERAELD